MNIDMHELLLDLEAKANNAEEFLGDSWKGIKIITLGNVTDIILKHIDKDEVKCMDEKMWHCIFKKYIDSFEAIKTLKVNNVIDDDLFQEMQVQLLEDVVVTLKSEVEN